MNLDDESHLSAYLDDELDPADRLAVEWSVESSPPLGEQLRSLGQARDAVAGLDRPAIPRDLAPALRARLAPDRRRAGARALARPARVAVAISFLSAVAASLIFALILLNHSLHPSEMAALAGRPRREATTLPPLMASSDPRPVPAPGPDPTGPTTRQIARSPRVDAPPKGVGPASNATPVVEAVDREARRSLARILDRRHAPRVVIVTDIVDAPDRIQAMIGQDARKDPRFGRVAIDQDVIIDPDRAEPAEVFAVPMQESGRRSFVDRLREKFPDLVEEGDSRPDLISQLPVVGQVAMFRGAEAAPLVAPPVDVRTFIANRTDTPADHFVRTPGSRDPNPPGSGAVASALKGKGPGPDGPAGSASNDLESGPDFVGPPNPYRSPSIGPDESIALVVWVTRPSRH